MRAPSASRRLRRPEGDDGFSLVEALVAMVLAMVVFMSVLVGLLTMTKGSLTARQNQQSIELSSRRIEALRALPIGDLANRDADLAGEPLVSGGAGARTFDPDGAGALAAESVMVSTTGQIANHTETVVANNTRYTVKTFVTKPRTTAGAVDASGDYRRLTVVTTWRRGDGTTAEKRTSTFMTNTRRGLPLPEFTFGAPVTKSVNASAQLVVPAVVNNLGARDEWSLSVSSNPTNAWVWSWYVDTNRNGSLDVDETTLLGTSASGAPVTGLLETDQPRHVLAVTTVPAGTGNGARIVTLQAQSVGQPSAPSATKSFASTITVGGGAGPVVTPSPTASASPSPSASPTASAAPVPTGTACAGCNQRRLRLLNKVLENGNSDANINNQGTNAYVSLMPVTTDEVRATRLDRYCGGDCPIAGRYLSKDGDLTKTDAKSRARWSYQVPSQLTLTKVNVSIFAKPRSNATDKAIGLKVGVYLVSGTTVTEVGVGEIMPSVAHGAAFKAISLDVLMSGGSRIFPASSSLQIRVVGHAGSGDDLDLAYATTTYPSSMTLYGTTGF